MLLISLFLAVFFVPTAFADTPGDGFDVGDNCGYVMGTSTSTYDALQNVINTGGNIVFDVGATYRLDRLCVKSTGYTYSTYTNGWSNQVGWIDFGWEKPITMNATDYWASVANIDPGTGVWSGYAWNEIVGWVWFDWACSDPDPDCATTNRVVTDMTTGDVTGFAWNDQIGWISFNGLTQEVPPMDITPSITIENGDGDLLSAIDFTNAPYADGYQYYRVKLILTDNVTGETLTSDDLDRVGFSVNTTSDTSMYLNQVTNEGTAIAANKINYALSDCESLPGTVYTCELTDATSGETSFNFFIYSGAPTSDMLLLDDIANDRAGGTTIYETPTGNGSQSSNRMTYFNDRSNSRNKYEIESIDFYLSFSDTSREHSVDAPFDYIDSATCTGAQTTCEQYTYTPTATTDLSFRPRIQPSNFTIYQDGEEGEIIGDQTSIGMYVHSYALVVRPSAEYRTVNTKATGGFYTVNYESASDATGTGDIKFLIDSAADGTMDSRQHVDQGSGLWTADSFYGNSLNVSKEYRLGYGQEATGETSGDYPTNPTLEQWVCDYLVTTATEPGQTQQSLVAAIGTNAGKKSCYFTGYLSRPDVHVDAYDMTLIGSINSSIGEETLVSSDTDGVSVLGITNYVSLRNNLYEQIARLLRNQTPTASVYCASLGTSMTVVNYSPFSCKTTSMTSLKSATLYYSNNDVYVQGSTSFTDKTLVVEGADVYILGNIYGGKLGIIALSLSGVGGNIYIDPDVTDLFVNIFADGTVFSDSGDNTGDPGGFTPVWTSTSARTEGLWNQIYIKGSIVSRNTIGGVFIEDDDYSLGDGTTTTFLATATEYDLNKLREFRMCYPTDASGNVDETGTPIDCVGEGSRSSQYTGSDAPVIVEYDPPSSSMPIFNISSLNISGR